MPLLMMRILFLAFCLSFIPACSDTVDGEGLPGEWTTLNEEYRGVKWILSSDGSFTEAPHSGTWEALDDSTLLLSVVYNGQNMTMEFHYVLNGSRMTATMKKINDSRELARSVQKEMGMPDVVRFKRTG